MDNEKKIAAAITAVMSYIQTEEEAICAASMMGGAPAVSEPVMPSAPVKLWGISGRQAQMQMRSLMQMKAFR